MIRLPYRNLASGMAVWPVAACLFTAQRPCLAAPTGPEQREAERIAVALKVGRTSEAQVLVDQALARFPSSGLIHMRAGQVAICRSLELDDRLLDRVRDRAFSDMLQRGIRFVETEHPAESSSKYPLKAREEMRQNRLQLAAAVRLPATDQFQARLQKGPADLAELAERSARALADARAQLESARTAGSSTTDLLLSDLWQQVATVIHSQHLRELEVPPPGLQGTKSGKNAPADVTPESVLRAAVRVSDEFTEDPLALAGAADVIAVVASLGKIEDPLRRPVMSALDRRYLKTTNTADGPLNSTAETPAAQLYRQARDSQRPNVATAPYAVALQLYERALKLDAKWSLPELRIRVFLLRLAFEPDEALPLLEALQRQRPGDAAVPLERARLEFLIKRNPVEGLKYCREAARLPSFSRRYLVAVPDVLQPAIQKHGMLRSIGRSAWPGYGWLFTTLEDVERAQSDPRLRLEIGLLRVHIADRLLQSPEYADQALAVDIKALALRALAEIPNLAEERKAYLQLLQADHQRTFASFPRSRDGVVLTVDGPAYWETPNLGRSPLQTQPRLFMMGNSLFLLPAGTSPAAVPQ
jgi:hypothetical protein